MARIQELAGSVWRRLPQGLRQRAAHAVIGRLAPAISPQSVLSADRAIPRIVVGLLSSPSGLGQSARLAAKALGGEGYQVSGIDLSAYFYETAGHMAHGLPDGRGNRGPAHVIVVINAPYLPYALWLLGRDFVRDKHVTGYWAWELEELAPNWKRGFAAVHDVAAPSRFVADAVAGTDPSKRVRVARYPAALDAPPSSPLLAGAPRPDQPFTVLGIMSVASGFARKNPVGLIRAFKLAFGERPDARLRMLVTGADHHAPARGLIEAARAGAGNIEISWSPLSRAALYAWWGTPDLVASLHRSEGFGLPIAEAMLAGYPALATGWSGNLDFMDGANSYLVDHTLVPVTDAQGKYERGRWAEPDLEHAASLMAQIAANPDEARAIGAAAARSAADKLSGRNFCAQLLG